eukprot:5217533-Prymnesium_polylepis.1
MSRNAWERPPPPLTAFEQQLITQGSQHYQQGDAARAIDSFRAAIAENSRSAQAYSNLGTVLYRSGRKPHAQALQAFRVGAKLAPSFGSFNLCAALMNTGRAAEA